MNKVETQYSRRWIGNLCKQITKRNERIRFVKIHGSEMQAWGISDYLLCWHGQFVAIEFKMYNNQLEDNQRDFLIDIIECEGIGMVVEIQVAPRIVRDAWIEELAIKDNTFIEGMELTALIKAENSKKGLIYKFLY